MPEFTNELVWPLFRSSTFIAVSAILVWSLLELLRVQSVRVHTLAWAVVLLQGLVLTSFEIEIEIPVANSMENVLVESALLDSTVADSQLVMMDDAEWLSSDTDNLTGSFSALEHHGLIESAELNRPDWSWSIRRIVFVVWLLGLTVAVGTMLASYLRFLWCLTEPHRPDNDWKAQWDRIQVETRSQTPIDLHVNQSLGPAICWTPTGYRLLIPKDAWASLSVSQRESILQHEIAHFHRKDLRNALLFRLIAALHWFNPFAWMAVRKLAECAEWSCDDFVRKFNSVQSTEYVRALMELSTPEIRVPVVIPGASGHSLIRRTQRLLKPQLKEDHGMKKITLLLLVAALVITNALSFQLVAQEPTSKNPVSQEPNASTSNAAKSSRPSSQTDSTASPVTIRKTVTFGFKATPPSQPVTVPETEEELLISNGAPNGIRIIDDSKPPVASKEAVIDLAYVFKNLPEFKKAMESIKKDIATEDARLLAERKVLQALAEQCKQAPASERAILQVRLAERKARMEVDRTTIREKFKQREADNYLSMYKKVKKAIADHAKENGIRIVRRATLREQKRKLESGDPQTILQALNQQILYVADENIDISDAVIKRLTKPKVKVETRKTISISVPGLEGLGAPVFSFFFGTQR